MIERTQDYRKIKARLDEMGSDFWNIIISSNIYYLMDDESILAFVPYAASEKTMQVHVYQRPKGRGKEGVKICKEAFEWIFGKTNTTVLLGIINKENKVSCFNAVHCGMKFMREMDGKRLYEVRK